MWGVWGCGAVGIGVQWKGCVGSEGVYVGGMFERD